MSTITYDPVVDPALQDVLSPSTATAKRQAGTKRKARASALPHNNNSQPQQHRNYSTSPTSPTNSTRLTRRQAAAAAAAIVPDGGDAAYAASPLRHGDEPSRGEEENLIGYEWARENAKRSRRRSPSAHGQGHGHPHSNAASSRPRTPTQAQQWAGSAHASAHPSAHPSPGTGGIDSLASAAAYQSNPSQPPPPPPPQYPYPFGLTPFRYPCLTPHLPPPPPGDPADPRFQAYNPYHGMEEPQTQAQTPATQQPVPPPVSLDQPSRSELQHLPERTEHTTLAALLSASEAVGGIDGFGLGHGHHGHSAHSAHGHGSSSHSSHHRSHPGSAAASRPRTPTREQRGR